MIHKQYQPQQWADVIGWQREVSIVRRLIEAPSYNGGAILITGASGTGKSSMATCIANALVQHTSRRHVLHGDKCTEATVQQLARTLDPGMFQPAWASVIVDESHNMTAKALGAWLNLLEYLPARVVVVFTTTERPPFTGRPNEIEAMQSRCFELELLLDDDTRAAFVQHIRAVADQLGFGGAGETAAFEYMAGHKWNLRRAINALPKGGLMKLRAPTANMLDALPVMPLAKGRKGQA